MFWLKVMIFYRNRALTFLNKRRQTHTTVLAALTAALAGCPSFIIQVCQVNLTRLSLKALVTTETELKAMAPPANTGLNSPAAATGIPIIL